MQPANRDRRHKRSTALCAALILCLLFCLTQPVTALLAEYRIADDGTSYNATTAITVGENGRFRITGPGMMGEAIPIMPDDLLVTAENGTIETTNEGQGYYGVPPGNYTLSYSAPVTDRNFEVLFDAPYNVTVHLPDTFSVTNKALAQISKGGQVHEDGDGVTVTWERVRFAQMRFYDILQETILFAFGTFWLAMVVIFALPYLMMRNKK